MEEEDWLLEEDVLLFEIVECGLLNGVEWSNEETATEARVLDSEKTNKNPLVILQNTQINKHQSKGER